MPVTILIADDHEVVRQGIRTILEARPQWEICGEAVNGLEAVKMAKELQPDVIIMDITMPVMSGLEATREVSKLNLKSRVLIFTMHESKSLADSVKKTGASGFVLKSRAARDLIEALERLIGGGTFFQADGASPVSEKNSPLRGLLFRQALGFA